MESYIFEPEEALRFVTEKKTHSLFELLKEAEPTDIALLFEQLEPEQYPYVFRILRKEAAAEVFVEMDSEMQEHLINAFTDTELRLILDELYLDDTVDIIEEMPANVVTRILKNSSSDSRIAINELLAYPKDSAGSMMTIEFVALRMNMTVAEAFEHIRQVGTESETIYTCYVTENRTLKGVLSVRTMLLADPETLVSSLMTTTVISVETTEDRETAAALMSKYDLLALPVVDHESRLVGIITVDDAIDVLSEEDEEDFAKMSAITPTDRPYLKTSPWAHFLTRIPWLLLLMISATFTGIIISHFENALASVTVLTAFIPMLMGTGGNAGSQSSVTVIRGLSLGEIAFGDALRVIWKEFRVSILCSVALALATFIKLILIDKMLIGSDITVLIAAVVSLTMAITVIGAKLIGSVMPLLAGRLGFDPAVMASPFITTLVDALSLLVYFSVASTLLGL